MKESQLKEAEKLADLRAWLHYKKIEIEREEKTLNPEWLESEKAFSETIEMILSKLEHQSQELEKLREALREAKEIIERTSDRYNADNLSVSRSVEWLSKYSALVEEE